MRYLSLFSGIEAASVAWGPLGWEPAAFAEIEPFPSAVLSHRFPNTPNLGDVTKHKEWPDIGPIDLICGGSPCQSFSVAGLRKGMDDPRGNMALVYLSIVDRYKPRWIVFENVPGLLSSNGGRDFGSFLGGLGQLGYGFAYRVLDAQFVRTCGRPFAVPQRRRRVFVVGYFGDWRPPAAVLIERESMCRNPPPRRKAGQGFAADVAGSLTGSGRGVERAGETRGQDPVVAARMVAFGEYEVDGTASAMKARDYKDATDLVAHTLKGEGRDASEGGTGRGVPLVPVAFDCKGTEVQYSTDGSHPTLRSMGHNSSHQNAGGHAAVASPWVVRRLSPVECERLQGFPDGWTDVPYRNRNATPDGPRYKALGNSMAENCMEYIGRRIALVEDIIKEQQKGQQHEPSETPRPDKHHRPVARSGSSGAF